MITIGPELAQYENSFLSKQEANAFYFSLLEGNRWTQEKISLFGKQVAVPRLVAWQGELGLNYRYSGTDHCGQGFDDNMERLKQMVEEKTKQRFNFVLLNLYRDGDDYMGFHSDREKSLGANPIIASLSFGATRRFVYKHKHNCTKVELELENGSLLLMHESRNSQWQHSLPKQRAIKVPRLNVSFRLVDDAQ